jgi:very-short-patch-repair endonuclease
VSKKANYLIKTLSRTKRKDYENYVINAIWNRLANDNIKPVTQQYVFNKEKNEGYLIDLFFPQLLVGIEIDERHHIFQKEEDYKRTDAIWHYFHKLESR